MAEHNLAYAALSLDGGGIRGILPCMVLAEIERLTQEPIADLFDVMSGTSTGGILACGLNIWEEQDGELKPQFTAAELLNLYTGDNGKGIFKSAGYGKILNFLRSILRPKYPSVNVEKILKENFQYQISGKQPKLSESRTDVLVTAYDACAKKPFYFKSSDARRFDYENYEMWQVARATSAAPTYFPPHPLGYDMPLTSAPKVKFYDIDQDQNSEKILETDSLNLLDGGVFANNPSMLAYIETRKKWVQDLKKTGKLNQPEKNLEEIKEMLSEWKASGNESDLNKIMGDIQKMMNEVKRKPRGMAADKLVDDDDAPILLISIGTGQSRKSYPYQKAQKWGSVRWVMPIVDIMMQGAAETVDYQMQYLLPNFATNNTPRYIRINIELDPRYSEMDDVSDENLERLQHKYGKAILDMNAEKLNLVKELLLDIKKVRDRRKAARSNG